MIKEKINRINELARKSKSEWLTVGTSRASQGVFS